MACRTSRGIRANPSGFPDELRDCLGVDALGKGCDSDTGSGPGTGTGVELCAPGVHCRAAPERKRAVDRIPTTADTESQVAATSETVRFQRPNDDVVQMLPGHLEVLSGDSRHQEIRFVRVQGQQPQLILGRNPGRSPQHIALNSSTVSRQHARLAFSGGKWAVANLSKTNPVVVNDQELSNQDGERPLSDGDRIELGEVVLRFHSH